RGVLAVQGVSSRADVRGGETVTGRVNPSAFFSSVDFDSLLAEVVDPTIAVTVAKGSQAYDSIVFQMTAGSPPAFEWSAP
ncbi:MAG: hypothetical protein H5U40_08810, partial [Polyangiaceae bacterium]|nr:hypothetical protein [Polyangiaceae bacterium]